MKTTPKRRSRFWEPDAWFSSCAVCLGLSIAAAILGPFTWQGLFMSAFLLLVGGAGLALFQLLSKPEDKP